MMNAVILNLNDTIAMSDSTVVELVKALNACQPCIHEAETSCNDVKIVGIICIAIVIVAFVAKWAIWSWKDAEIQAAKEERTEKEKEADIAARKQKADAQGKLLDFLKEKVSSFDMQKKEYEKACDNYKDFLEQTIMNHQDYKSIEDESRIQLEKEQEKLKDVLEKRMELFLRKDEEYNKACENYEKELRRIIS